MKSSISISNKKAHYEYFVLEKFVAGVQLTGTEIKSIRAGKVSLAESYCSFLQQELYVKNMHISEYEFGTYSNHEPRRVRKLLLNKRELKKLKTKTEEKGMAIIPVSLFINEKGLAKLEIALCKGKKLYDKRETIKGKDIQRQIERQQDY